MKDYLKMADVFDCEVESDADLMFSDSLGSIADFSGYKSQCRYSAHAINSHDELVVMNKELLIHLERCAKELTSMINRHNKQSMEDGSWLYDQQTPYEAMWLIDRLNGIKPPAKDTINCDLYVAGGAA